MLPNLAFWIKMKAKILFAILIITLFGCVTITQSFDYLQNKRFAKYGNNNIDAMICDSAFDLDLNITKNIKTTKGLYWTNVKFFLDYDKNPNYSASVEITVTPILDFFNIWGQNDKAFMFNDPQQYYRINDSHFYRIEKDKPLFTVKKKINKEQEYRDWLFAMDLKNGVYRVNIRGTQHNNKNSCARIVFKNTTFDAGSFDEKY